MKDIDVKDEPDFIETHCHWIGCDREFGTQDELVRVRQPIYPECKCWWW